MLLALFLFFVIYTIDFGVSGDIGRYMAQNPLAGLLALVSPADVLCRAGEVAILIPLILYMRQLAGIRLTVRR